MLKISYDFIALQPIHTGSDENLGILKTLRREKVNVLNPRKIKSRFTSEQNRLKRQAVALLLMRCWDKMDKSGNMMTIYEQVAAKLLASTAVRTKEEFLQALCKRLGIREITTNDNRRFDVIDILELFDDYELLALIRAESQYIMSMFRKVKDENTRWNSDYQKGKTAVAKNTLFGAVDEVRSPEVLISDDLEKVLHQPFKDTDAQNSIDNVPTISGNSIRGYLRRLVMADFCDTVGITGLSDIVYHQMFTGGTLNSSGTGFQEIGQRIEMIQMNPMIGLLGSAVANQTIQGELRVGQAKVRCQEYGTGNLSYHDLINVVFATRLDSSKLENELKINETALGKDDTNQMKYEYEVFITGAIFEHSFACTTENPMIVSAFWRMLELFKQQPFITAKGSVGHGELDLSGIEIPEGASDLYLNHLRDNAEKICKYWAERSIPKENAKKGKPEKTVDASEETIEE